ncbi:hypothetical protein [Clostridium baratii]|nr:hypothetical protein [Clostridium baratii]MDU1053454.1 hypothetical protein [Clostridium baratii]
MAVYGKVDKLTANLHIDVYWGYYTLASYITTREGTMGIFS